MMKDEIKFKDLSTWLQVAIVWAFVNLGVTALAFLVYAIIGIFSLS